MIKLDDIPINRQGTSRLQTVFADVLAETLRQDSCRTAGIKLVIQDGTIGYFCRQVKKTEK
jgi:hypothetical protein